MVYEVRVKGFMGSGSTSLGKYFKEKNNAEKLASELNEYISSMYFVKEIKLEDGEEE